MDELKPCPICGWCDGKHKPISADNKTTPNRPTTDNKTDGNKRAGDFDRIMANMRLDGANRNAISEDGFTILVYYTPFSTGYWTEKQSAIDEIVEWLKKECDA